MYFFCWHRSLWWWPAVFNPGVRVWRDRPKEHWWKGTWAQVSIFLEVCVFQVFYKAWSPLNTFGVNSGLLTLVTDLTDAFVIVWFNMNWWSYFTKKNLLSVTRITCFSFLNTNEDIFNEITESPFHQKFKKDNKRNLYESGNLNQIFWRDTITFDQCTYSRAQN